MPTRSCWSAHNTLRVAGARAQPDEGAATQRGLCWCIVERQAHRGATSLETDIPLKVLAETRAADLLPLLGVAGAHVLRVRSIELPATAKRLDTLLSLGSPAGQCYRLLVEWQGYRDPLLLWRVLEYLARLGPQGADEEGPLLVVIIYVD